jgi:hypothetical protein
MTNTQKEFDYWFNWHGHWIYPSKDDALRIWKTRGIDGLSDYQEEQK